MPLRVARGARADPMTDGGRRLGCFLGRAARGALARPPRGRTERRQAQEDRVEHSAATSDGGGKCIACGVSSRQFHCMNLGCRIFRQRSRVVDMGGDGGNRVGELCSKKATWQN
eukprot:1981937-Pyramimonas_sp.AAC.1